MTATDDTWAAAALDEALLDPDGTDQAALGQVLEPFGRSRMLPAAAYTSPAVLAWERRHLFAGTWTCVGREVDMRTGAEGELTRRAVQVGDVSVLLTWEGEGGDAALRAFANTCRHRGHELVPRDGAEREPAASHGDQPRGQQSIVCPYHAWTYDLAGRLRAAPGFRAVEGFDQGEHSLVGLTVERWHGWVFVHALRSLEQGSAVPFEQHLGDLQQIVGPYAPERLV
ncbi:MAG: Rieske 2Fe-2S domain-containing protein, partial [Nocardioidaceae bacterium]|nr:Rieske 2Fe-2S domain-containing protein [Nocardioidaceae bacterium]